MHDLEDDRPVICAILPGISCSVCAPLQMNVLEVEAFANKNAGTPEHTYFCVDKSELGLGATTPSPCNRYPERRHWFLITAAVLIEFSEPESPFRH